MTETMLERVARALFEQDGRVLEQSGGHGIHGAWTWDEQRPRQAAYRASARAAIEAMRSMSGPMIDAAQEAYCTSGHTGDLRTAPISVMTLADIYHAAIDAALSETPE